MPLEYTPLNSVPLPPVDAKVQTTACAYCVVACGYKAYTWPVGQDGGPTAAENALGINYPTAALQPWISPNQHNIVEIDGAPHNIVIVPDAEATVVNKGGNHSIRGGTLAKKLFNPETPTAERLQRPMLRVNGILREIEWETAIDIMAAVSEHVLDKYGESSWAVKTYSYEFFMNTYAITKLALGAIKTPAFCEHDKPAQGNDTAGFDDCGLINFNASYDDWQEADVLFVSGTDPFESKTVLFTEFMMKGPKLIIAVPRRSTGVAFAEANGGLFLQVIPGTDTLLHLAISRYILENDWQDQEFIDEWIASSWEINAGMGRGTRNTPWQWRTTWGQFGTDYEGYKEWILNYEMAELEKAAEITGVPVEKIVQAAEMLTGAGEGERPKASFGFEKGNYWSNNYLNTASYASMGLLCGAGNRPGQAIGRLGGHQRGMMKGAHYPRDKSPEKNPGRRKIELDLDRWVEGGNVRFAWVIGTTWTGAMAASQEFENRFRELTVGNPHQVDRADKQAVIDTLIQRVDSGGMVVVNSDIYPVVPMGTEFADIILPAAQWGEHEGARCNGERRLRYYAKLMDPPGEAKPDWWAVSQFAQKMGYEGFDWADANEIFEEAARFSRGGVLDYNVLVWKAKQDGMKGLELLDNLGTTGIQTPVRMENGEMVGTKRIHDSTLVLGPPEGPTVHAKWLTHFRSHSGKALFIKTPWEIYSDFFERITPDREKGEFWITTSRINEIWQSGFDEIRKPYLENRWPDTFVEINPADAEVYGIESGDDVRMYSDDILIQTGGWNRVKPEEIQFSWLEENGFIKQGNADVRAVAIVTEAVPPGVMLTNFLHPSSPANALVHRVPDPITNRYRFKLGKGQIERIGESEFKTDPRFMTFKPRDVV